MPRYLDPTIDLVFKKLFGDKSHKEVIIDFLNNILELKPGEFITTVTFNDPFNRKRNKQDKLSIGLPAIALATAKAGATSRAQRVAAPPLIPLSGEDRKS